MRTGNAPSSIVLPRNHALTGSDDGNTGVDEAWQRIKGTAGAKGKPLIKLAERPEGDDLYFYNTNAKILSGAAAGYTFPLESLEGNALVVGQGFGLPDLLEKLALIKPGDEILLDNSDYIAIQTFHRHQLPDESYEGFKQFRDDNGNPIYPQRSMLLGPTVSYGGAGSIQSGKFEGKMIVVAAAMDESAFPWQADWYKSKVKESFGDKLDDYFRLWYFDNALHDDAGKNIDELHTCGYLGALHQALLDLSDWVERDIEPARGTNYNISGGQLELPNSAEERCGIQPIVTLSVCGSDCITVKAGEAVNFTANIELPVGTGNLTKVEWSFDGDQDFPIEGEFLCIDDVSSKATIYHTFDKPGTHFAVVRVSSQRTADAENIFTQVRNISRVRINVL